MAVCGKTVAKQCSARWNSVLLTIQRLLSIKIKLQDVLNNMKHDSLSNTKWVRLSDNIQRLLLPFREQTDNLQTDTMSLPSVISSLLELSLYRKNETLPKPSVAQQAAHPYRQLMTVIASLLHTTEPAAHKQEQWTRIMG